MTAREDVQLAAAVANGAQAAPLSVVLASHPDVEGKVYVLDVAGQELILPEDSAAAFALTLLADYFERNPLRPGAPARVPRELIAQLAAALAP